MPVTGVLKSVIWSDETKKYIPLLVFRLGIITSITRVSPLILFKHICYFTECVFVSTQCTQKVCYEYILKIGTCFDRLPKKSIIWCKVKSMQRNYIAFANWYIYIYIYRKRTLISLRHITSLSVDHHVKVPRQNWFKKIVMWTNLLVYQI